MIHSSRSTENKDNVSHNARRRSGQNGWSTSRSTPVHETDTDLDAKCVRLLEDDSVREFLCGDQVELRTDNDEFPPLEYFVKEIHSDEAKKKLFEDLQVKIDS